MSRPFSYNDENFTVINNILFAHINIGAKAYNKGDKICTIPPAIYDRLVTYNFVATITNRIGLPVSGNILIYITKDGDVITDSNITVTSYTPRLVIAWFLLKDI